MAPTITASTSTYLQRPGHLTSLKHHKKKKKVLKTSQGRSFQSKSGGLHNINLVLSTHERQHHRRRGNAAHIDLSDPSRLRKKDKARLAQLEKDIPVLNGVVPAGVSRAGRNGNSKGAAGGSGKKKGKKFVEDAETMHEILRMVNEVKEVKVEEKLEKGVGCFWIAWAPTPWYVLCANNLFLPASIGSSS